MCSLEYYIVFQAIGIQVTDDPFLPHKFWTDGRDKDVWLVPAVMNDFLSLKFLYSYLNFFVSYVAIIHANFIVTSIHNL
jgi:hypothetical protein